MKDKRTIVYINFSPYVNSGNILDYIRNNFENILVFSFNFYSLGKTQDKSNLTIFKNGKIIKKYYLFQISMNMPISLLFLFLPLRSLLIFMQIIWYLIKLKKRYVVYDIYFTVNAFPAWLGNILRKTKIVRKTIYWVWDYYPPIHSNKIVTFMRWIYWQFDRSCAKSDSVVYLNKRLIELRKNIGAWNEETNYKIIPIGTNPILALPYKKLGKRIRIVFLGVLKKSQGIEIIFNNAEKLIKEFKNINLEIIGSGPDSDYFKSLAKKSKIKTKFYKFVPDEKRVRGIISKNDIGLATYIPEESNVSYFGDPSKIKLYLSQGLPVITTNVFTFYKEIKKSNAGIIINYSNTNELIYGIKNLYSKYDIYRKNALALSKKYDYKKIYKEMFKI